jgi:formylglycine-generating enzyme required for sulfatase activity
MAALLRILLLLAGLAAAPALAQTPEQLDRAVAAYEAGMAALKRGDLAEAERQYKIAQENAPNARNVLKLKGEIAQLKLKPQKQPDAPAPDLPRNYTETVGGVEFTMIYVEGGTFQMGDTFGEGSSDEKPVHPVTLDGYYLGQTEVTQALWRAVMGNNPSYFKDCDQCPVEQVSWEDAQAFIQKLNQRTGKKYALPTEAQWEFAARGGTKSQGYKYAGSGSEGDVAWYGGNSDSKTHPAANKKANELGLYDMSGNVWEWCQDWYDTYPSSPARNPTGPSTGSNRVYRGGSWVIYPQFLRVADRSSYAPTYSRSGLGFRLARID